MRVRWSIAIVGLAVLASTMVGQGQAPVVPNAALIQLPSDTAPVFRSQVEAVAIDVFVTDAAGMPVSGLTIDDFEIQENGKPQPATTFRAVNLPVDTRESDRPIAEPDVVSNDQPQGRIYVFALGVEGAAQALRTRKFLRDFIDRHFGPDDVAAVVSLQKGLSTDGQDFTSNRRLIVNAVDNFSGGFTGEQSSQPEILVRALKEVVEVLGRMPGQHKSLLYFSDHAGYPWGDLIDYQGGGVGSLGFAGGDYRSVSLAPGSRQSVMGRNSLMFDHAHGAMTIATRNNLTIYPIDPAGLTLNNDGVKFDDRQDFRALAQITGGFAHVNSNDFAGAFERIVRDASTYYMLGFNSGYTKNDGKFIRLDVRVKRPGLTARARNGYVNANRFEYEAAAKKKVSRKPVSEALANPLTSAGHPMRLVAAAFKGAAGKANVVLTLETALVPNERQPRADLRSGSVEIRFVTTDAKRKIYPEIRHIGTLSIPASLANTTGDRIRLVAEWELPEGRYQIRAAAGADRVGGGVVYDLEVPDFSSQPLMLSGLSLTSSGSPALSTMSPVADKKKMKTRTCRENECTAAEVREVPLVPWSAAALSPSDPLFNALPEAPTTVRAFRRSETVTVFAEVYDNDKAPRDVDVRATLQQPNTPAALTVSRQQSASEPRRASGGSGVTLALPLATVPPGRYVLRVEAHAAGDEQAAVREIPVEVLP